MSRHHIEAGSKYNLKNVPLSTTLQHKITISWGSMTCRYHDWDENKQQESGVTLLWLSAFIQRQLSLSCVGMSVTKPWKTSVLINIYDTLYPPGHYVCTQWVASIVSWWLSLQHGSIACECYCRSTSQILETSVRQSPNTYNVHVYRS